MYYSWWRYLGANIGLFVGRLINTLIYALPVCFHDLLERLGVKQVMTRIKLTGEIVGFEWLSNEEWEECSNDREDIIRYQDRKSE